MNLPGAIVFVNNDLSESARATLIRQLFITDVQDGYVFDAYVAADSNYPDNIRLLDRRLMVIRTFEDRGTISTWTHADVVIFVKMGLASILENKFGPPGLTLSLGKICWGALGIF